MDWIIGLVLFIGGLILGGLIMLFTTDDKQVDEIRAKRLETIEKLLKNQGEINQIQMGINQTQMEMNKHLADWIRAVSKMEK